MDGADGARPDVDGGIGGDASDTVEQDAAPSDPSDTDHDGNGVPDSGGGGAEVPSAWVQYCAGCHGAGGRGGIAPGVRPWTRDRTLLIDEIVDRMPPEDPTLCGADCADSIAEWLLSDGPVPDESACPPGGEVVPAERTIRTLTRSELARTLGVVLQPPLPSCTDSIVCGFGATCASGVCTPLPCGEVEFALAGHTAASSVVVAGSFNEWASTVAAGGLAMTRAGGGPWTARASLPPGRYAYKFVVDTTWLPDPRSAESEDDGFGSRNSVLRVTCDGASGAASVDTTGLDAEIRPTHFLFNTHVRGVTWTSGRVEDTLGLADRLVAERTDEALVAWLGCDPRGDTACSARALDDLLLRVFRQQPSAAQRARYAALVSQETNTLEGFRLALRAALASPLFLYRTELGTDDGAGGLRLDPFEVAQSMSYALWGGPPDARLFSLASSGAIYDPDVRRTEATRMLADPRARDRIGEFTEQWLGIERVRTSTRSASVLPSYTQALRDAMVEETLQFVTHVIFDGSGRLSELLRADYTLANADLVALYGWAGAVGAEFARVPHGDASRAGFLGHASVLAATSHSDQTSPIRRGLFIRQHLLCQDFPEPPADANGVPEVDPDATTRDRFQQHTDDPFCASCHQYIDPTGFGFERFDAVGRLRSLENGRPIDSLGDMNDIEGFGTGTRAPFDTLQELARTLDTSRAANACFVRQYHRFVTGRGGDEQDACTLAALEDQFLATGGHIPTYLVELVASDTFLRRR